MGLACLGYDIINLEVLVFGKLCGIPNIGINSRC